MRRGGHPAPDDVRQVLLQSNDDRRADYRAKEGPGAAQQRHQDNLAGGRLLDIRKRYEAQHQGLQRTGEPRERRGEHERDQLVATDFVAK